MSDTLADPRPARVGRGGQRNRSVYEDAGPNRLALTSALAKIREPDTDPAWPVLKRHLEARLNMWRSWRLSWIQHWLLLETYVLPRRGIFINAAQPTPNMMNRGAAINQNIVDPTGTYAMRRCAAGMMSGLMSPSRQWFKLKPALGDREDVDDAADAWFEEVENRIYTVMGRSNFYESAAQLFEDLCTFGTSPMIIYEDASDVIRCYVPCCGEYFCASSSANRVESLGRLFVMTISAIVEMFGLENCPMEIRSLWESKGGAIEIERLVAHVIEPNFEVHAPGNSGGAGVIRGNFAWREAYWIWGASTDRPLSLTGFVDQPHLVPRWSVTSNDAYGRSVGMDVLPDIIQLQVETSRKAEAIEKMVRPPMLASLEMKNEPSSILPGKVTYVKGLGADTGMRPAFTVNPEIREMMEDIKEIQLRIKEGYFNDLFAMLEQTGQKQMTAFEVAQRNQEKLQVIGPVVERLQNEALAPAIKRIARILDRKGLLPPLPPSLVGTSVGIEYVGILALAQKAAKTASLERFAQTSAVMAQTHPEILDNVDWDKMTQEYADDLFIPKSLLRSPEQVAAIRQKRAQQMQQEQQLAGVEQASKIGQNLSSIDVGGGLNAISMMTGLGPSGGAAPGGV